MNKDKYPTPYDIQEVLNSFSKRHFVDLFSQKRGIFYINTRQRDVARSLSNILYDKKDIDELRASAYQTVSKHTMSGFSLKSSKDFNLQELYEQIRDNDRKILDNGYKLHSLVKTSKGTDQPIYKGSIEYKKKKPGRIEFLDEEIGYTEFYLIDLENGEWQVEVDGNKSTDGKAVLKLISNMIDKNSIDIFDINIDSLKLKNTIDFFDELTKVGLGAEWKFSDIKHLSFKRGRNLIDEDEENDEESIEKEQLTGISQAVLEGRNLRDDPFVLQYEKEGCIFSAMTYEFEHLKNPETIQLKAEFKGSPKIFEVSVVSYKITKGLEAKKENASLTEDENRKIRSLFWNNAKLVYLQLIADEDHI